MSEPIRVLVVDDHIYYREGIKSLLATRAPEVTVVRALRAGARGYLLQDAPVDDLVRAIQAAHRGQAVLAPQAAERVQRFVRAREARYPDRITDA